MHSRARFGFQPLIAGAIFCSLLSPNLARAQYPGATPVPAELKKGFDSITVEETKKWLTFLATKCDGRGSVQPGFQKAAEYVAERFKEFGLKPVGDNGTYFQMVPFSRSRFDAAGSFMQVESATDKIGASGKFAMDRLGADVDLTAPIVFVRAKGVDAKLAEDASFSGKIVVLATQDASPRFRFGISATNPAAVFVIADKIAEPDWQSGRSGGRRGGSVGRISLTAAQALAKSLGLAPSVLDAKATATNTVDVADAKGQVHLVMKGEHEDIKVPNVVGLLEGSDPTLKEELIGVGGHLDHLGKNGDTVYPGADDDGSGSTAVLAVARAATLNPMKPKRSVLFMTFCGEELGLIGSRYYAEHPIFPHEKMLCELQMDMVGRDSDGVQNGDQSRVDVRAENIDTIRLVGSKRISQELDDIIQEQNKHVGFKFKYDAEDVYTRSDHYSFAAKGIPISFLFDGFHPDYHQPTDTIDKIDWAKLTNSAKLYYLTLEVAANLDHHLARNGSDVKKTGGSPD